MSTRTNAPYWPTAESFAVRSSAVGAEGVAEGDLLDSGRPGVPKPAESDFLFRCSPNPYNGLAWMDFFVVYLSLPALFYRILARTPFEQLNNVRFILAVTLGTLSGAGSVVLCRPSDTPQSRGVRHRGARGSLRQYRLHGARTSSGDGWRAGSGPRRADLLLRDAAVLCAAAGHDGAGAADLSWRCARDLRGSAQDPAASVRGRDGARRRSISRRPSRSTGCYSFSRTHPLPVRGSRSA